jgi:hypothetical protein
MAKRLRHASDEGLAPSRGKGFCWVTSLPVEPLQQVAWLDFVGAGGLGRQAEAARGGFLFPTEWKRHVWEPDSLK